MKKAILLLLACLLILGGFSISTSIAETVQYADQAAFLRDMAEGITQRLNDDKDSSKMTAKEKADYYLTLVGYELDRIEKYETQVFEDSVFDDLAHLYINACQTQRFAAQNYKNSALYDALWEGGRKTRSAIIVELYSRYDLPITSEQAAQYAPSTSYTISYSSSSSNDTETTDNEQTKDYEKAVSLFNEGFYVEAQAIFKELGNYEDSISYLEKCDIEIKYAEKNKTNESDFRESCYSLDSDINYDELLRYPEKYKGVHITFSGKVTDQPKENYSEKVAWCETKKIKMYGYYDFSGNKAQISYKEDTNKERIIRNDYVRFYGVFEGLTSFHSLGGTYDVPVFTAYYYTIIPPSWLKIY